MGKLEKLKRKLLKANGDVEASTHELWKFSLAGA
jgi:hypothetical protein